MSEHRMFENTAVNQALPRGILLLFSCWDELPSKQLLQQPVIHRPYGWALKPEQGWQHTLRAHPPSQQKIRICKHLLYCFRSEQQSNLPDLTVLKSLQQPHFYHSPQRSRHPSMSELLFFYLCKNTLCWWPITPCTTKRVSVENIPWAPVKANDCSSLNRRHSLRSYCKSLQIAIIKKNKQTNEQKLKL